MLGPSSSLHFILYPVQSWLVPLCFRVEDRHLTPPYEHSLSDLPCQTVSESSSHPGVEYCRLAVMNLLLVFLYEGVRVGCLIFVNVFFSSCVNISARFPNIGCAAVLVSCLVSHVVAQSTLHLVANITPSTRATFSPSSNASYAVVVCTARAGQGVLFLNHVFYCHTSCLKYFKLHSRYSLFLSNFSEEV